ncbi:MAG: hypothetical protein ACK45W_19920, partial [Pseudanabaena sp.]
MYQIDWDVKDIHILRNQLLPIFPLSISKNNLAIATLISFQIATLPFALQVFAENKLPSQQE